MPTMTIIASPLDDEDPQIDRAVEALGAEEDAETWIYRDDATGRHYRATRAQVADLGRRLAIDPRAYSEWCSEAANNEVATARQLIRDSDDEILIDNAGGQALVRYGDGGGLAIVGADDLDAWIDVDRDGDYADGWARWCAAATNVDDLTAAERGRLPGAILEMIDQ